MKEEQMRQQYEVLTEDREREVQQQKEELTQLALIKDKDLKILRQIQQNQKQQI